MNIFIREFRAGRRALLIWSGGMFLLVLSGMGKFETYAQGAGQSGSDLFAKLPHALRAVLGLIGSDPSTPLGYYALLFSYILLAVGIHAALLGAAAVAAEERDKTAEFLYARPVSRQSILAAKLVWALCAVIAVNLVTWASSAMLVSYYAKGADIAAPLARMTAALFFGQLVFLSLGAFVAALLRRPGSAGSAAAGVLLGTYVAAKALDVADAPAAARVVTPFSYFDPAALINGAGGFRPGFVILSLALTAVFTAFAFAKSARRDLRI